MLSAVPKMTLYAPMSFDSLELAIRKCVAKRAPSAVRYPNSTEIPEIIGAFEWDGALKPKATFSDAPETVIITYGRITCEALRARDTLAAEGASVGVIMLEQLMPHRDVAAALAPMLDGAGRILFVEESVRAGCVGMMLADVFRREYPDTLGKIPTDILAIEDGAIFGERGHTLYESAGISARDIVRRIKNEK